MLWPLLLITYRVNFTDELNTSSSKVLTLNERYYLTKRIYICLVFFFFSAINQNNHSWREVVLLVNYFSKDAEGKHKNITFFFRNMVEGMCIRLLKNNVVMIHMMYLSIYKKKTKMKRGSKIHFEWVSETLYLAKKKCYKNELLKPCI